MLPSWNKVGQNPRLLLEVDKSLADDGQNLANLGQNLPQVFRTENLKIDVGPNLGPGACVRHLPEQLFDKCGQQHALATGR